MRTLRILSLGTAGFLLAAGLSSGVLEGCSSSSGSGGTSLSEDGGKDATSSSDSGADTSTPQEASTFPDSSTTEASTGEAGVTDSGPTAEAGEQDSGEDGGGNTGADAGNDSGGTTAEAGSDGSSAEGGSDAAGEEAGIDAGSSDGATEDAEDGASGPSFTNPVQVTGIPFNANTVVATATGGVALTAIDGAGNNNDYPTANEVVALGGSAANGLPNSALFATNGTTIPPVQLAWSDTTNVLNSIVLPLGTQTTFQISLSQDQQAQYQDLQIYATGGNAGGSGLSVSYTLTYASGSPNSASGSINVPDWCVPSNPPPVLASVDRVRGGTTLDTSHLCNIYAINLSVDSTRTLTSVSFSFAGSGSNYFVFYGATAW